MSNSLGVLSAGFDSNILVYSECLKVICLLNTCLILDIIQTWNSWCVYLLFAINIFLFLSLNIFLKSVGVGYKIPSCVILGKRGHFATPVIFTNSILYAANLKMYWLADQSTERQHSPMHHNFKCVHIVN